MTARMASTTAIARKRAEIADHASDDNILALLICCGETCAAAVNIWLKRQQLHSRLARQRHDFLRKYRTKPDLPPLVSLRSERNVAWRAGPVVGPAEVSHGSRSEYAPAAEGLGRGVWCCAISYPARLCRLSVR